MRRKVIYSLLIILTTIILISSVCFAKDGYSYIGGNNDCNAYVLDTSKVYTENYIECWVKYVFTNNGISKLENKKIRYAMHHSKFFIDKTCSTLDIIFYDKAGNVMELFHVEAYMAPIESIVPETATEAVWNYLYQ